MDDNDDITVVIPVHSSRIRNGMLSEALKSLHKQTHRPDVILVIEDKNGEGAAVTRQRGLDQVTTKWVAFLDSDDEYKPEHLRKLLKCAKKEDADFVFSWYQVRGGRDPMPKKFGKAWDPENPHLTTIVCLVKTELAKQVGFIHEHDGTKRLGSLVGEDWFFVRGINDLGAKIVHLPEKTWIWNHHGNNTSGQPTKGDATTPKGRAIARGTPVRLKITNNVVGYKRGQIVEVPKCSMYLETLIRGGHAEIIDD